MTIETDEDPTKGRITGTVDPSDIVIGDEDKIIVALTRTIISDEENSIFANPNYISEAVQSSSTGEYEYFIEADPGTYYLYSFIDSNNNGYLELGNEFMSVYPDNVIEDNQGITIVKNETISEDMYFPATAYIEGTITFTGSTAIGQRLLIAGIPDLNTDLEQSILKGNCLTSNWLGFYHEMEYNPEGNYDFSIEVNPFDYTVIALIDENCNNLLDPTEHFSVYVGEGTEYSPEVLSLLSGESLSDIDITLPDTSGFEKTLVVNAPVQSGGGSDVTTFSESNPDFSWEHDTEALSYLVFMKDKSADWFIELVMGISSDEWCSEGTCSISYHSADENYVIKSITNTFVDERFYTLYVCALDLSPDGVDLFINEDNTINYLPLLKRRINVGTIELQYITPSS